MKKLINFSLFIALIASSGSLPLHAQESTEQKSSFLPAWAQGPGFQAAKKWWQAGRDESVLSSQEKRAFKRLKRKVKLGTIVTAIGTVLGAGAYWYLNEQQKQAAHTAAARAASTTPAPTTAAADAATASATGPDSSSRSESDPSSSKDDSQDSTGAAQKAAADAAAASATGSDSNFSSESDPSSSEDDSHHSAASDAALAQKQHADTAGGIDPEMLAFIDEQKAAYVAQKKADVDWQIRWTAATGGGVVEEVKSSLPLTNQWQDALGQWIVTNIPLVASSNPKTLIKFDLPTEPTLTDIIAIPAWVETPADTSNTETHGVAIAARHQPKATTTAGIGTVLITEKKGEDDYTYTGTRVNTTGQTIQVGVDFRMDYDHPRGLYLLLKQEGTPPPYTTKKRIPFFIG